MGQTAEKLVTVCWQAQVPYIVVASLQEAVEKAVKQAKNLALSHVVFSP